MCPFAVTVMDPGISTDVQRRSSSSFTDRKLSNPETDRHGGRNKKRKETQEVDDDPQPVCASPSSVDEPSQRQNVNNDSVCVPVSNNEQLTRLTALLIGVLRKLDKSAEAGTSQENFLVLVVFTCFPPRRMRKERFSIAYRTP